MTDKKAQRFNNGKLDWTLLDFKSIEPLVDVMTYGLTKYGRENWKLPCDDPIQHIQSALRHLIAMANGEQLDKESKLPHSGHVMANMMMYNYHAKVNDEVIKLEPTNADDAKSVEIVEAIEII